MHLVGAVHVLVSSEYSGTVCFLAKHVAFAFISLIHTIYRQHSCVIDDLITFPLAILQI